jgi:hypothetical protein
MLELPPDRENPFSGPKSKVARARRFIEEHHEALDAFINGGGATLDGVNDPLTGVVVEIVHRITANFPEEIRLAAADALYNLRSSLDQAVSRCVVLADRSPDSAYFPHGKNKAGFQRAIDKQANDIPAEIQAALVRREPYYGGAGHLLRALHDLNIADKHYDLIKITAQPQQMGRKITVGTVGNRAERRRLKRLQDSGKPFTTSVTAPVEDDEFTLSTAVVFSNLEEGNTDSSVQTLTNMADECESLILEFERLMSVPPYVERWPAPANLETRIKVAPNYVTMVVDRAGRHVDGTFEFNPAQGKSKS